MLLGDMVSERAGNSITGNWPARPASTRDGHTATVG